MSKQNKNGITLIALIITIIVMLILVGVTVTVAINGGLIGTAKRAKEETRYSQILEEKEIWEVEKSATDRFGIEIEVETVEEFIDRLKDKKLLTSKEAECAKQTGAVTIAEKVIIFSGNKVVGDKGVWEYTLDEENNYAIITKYIGSVEQLTELTIPNVLEIDGKEYRVDEIKSTTFGVPIVNFAGKIIISNGIKKIGWGAFHNANKITSVEISDTVQEIGGFAFQYCSGLKTIRIPGNVKTIGGYWDGRQQAFNGCGNLESVILEEGVEYIGNRAFSLCGKLTSVSLPDTVKRIGTWAFKSCPISIITIPSSVEQIGDRAFDDCKYKSITIPSSVKIIGSQAFANGEVSSINVEKENLNFASIDGVLFNYDKTKLIQYPVKKEGEKYEIPSTVNEIEEYCFQNCRNIVQIEISEQVEKVGVNTFLDTSNLQQINVATTNGYYLSDNGVLYNKDKTEIIRYPQAKEGATHNIPSTVKTIKQKCFYGSKITEITIPENVENIESSAFTNCYSLTSITINKPEGSISGSPWGARTSVLITWMEE